MDCLGILQERGEEERQPPPCFEYFWFRPDYEGEGVRDILESADCPRMGEPHPMNPTYVCVHRRVTKHAQWDGWTVRIHWGDPDTA